jgi:hypothetical protein
MPTTYANAELGTWAKADITVSDNSIQLLFKVFWKVHEMVVPCMPTFTTDGFLTAWQAKVSEQWDNKFTMAPIDSLRSVRTVSFRLETTDNLDAAHMPVYIMNGNYAANGGLVFPTLNFFGGDRMFLRLNAGDNRTYSEGQADAIAAGRIAAFKPMFDREIDRVKAAVAAVLAGNGTMELTLDRGANQTTWTLPDATRNKLNLLAAALQATPDYYPQPVIKLTVSSGIREKGTAIATAITSYLTGQGVHVPTLINNVVKTSRKFHVPFSGHKATASATIEIQDSAAMYRNVRAGQAVADYCVSAHEFGHMFGLPDEYLDYTAFNNDKMKRSQPLWDRWCDQHDPAVPKRNWRAQFNDSAMSIGTRVYKAHAVTIWEAMERLTGERWRILSPA